MLARETEMILGESFDDRGLRLSGQRLRAEVVRRLGSGACDRGDESREYEPARESTDSL